MSLSIFKQFNHFIWDYERDELNPILQAIRHFLQIMALVIRDLRQGLITLRAMSLVYTTLLSFVPLLAVSFSVLKGFGVHNQIEPFLLNFMSPLGDQSVEVTNNIVGFVENMKIGVLGALGLGMLMYTVISLIQKIESSFNYTWRLSAHRNLAQRFSNYLSVVMVGPVLIFSALGISASLQSQSIVNVIENLPYMGDVIKFLGLLIPILLVIMAFTFVYKLVPNTQVGFKSALYGAVISGILWKMTGSLFATFAGGSTSYTAIYSGFAILMLFMIWLYLGWLILLIGASISYYHQNPQSLRYQERRYTFSAHMREKLTLQLMLAIGRAHYQPEKYKATLEVLMNTIKAPHSMTQRMLQCLLNSHLIVLSEGPDAHYLPASSIDQITLAEILSIARNAEDEDLTAQLQTDRLVDDILHKISRAINDSVDDKTLRDLVLESL